MIFGFGRARNGTTAIFRAVSDSRSSFFAPKPHGNACYADYDFSKWGASSYATKQVNFASSSFCLPARATPNREMSRVYVKKRTKWRTEPPACPSPFQWGRLFPFAGSGRVISGLLVDRFRSRFGTNTSVELLALYLSNTVIR